MQPFLILIFQGCARVAIAFERSNGAATGLATEGLLAAAGGGGGVKFFEGGGGAFVLDSCPGAGGGAIVDLGAGLDGLAGGGGGSKYESDTEVKILTYAQR